jgi:hypothetical protein
VARARAIGILPLVVILQRVDALTLIGKAKGRRCVKKNTPARRPEQRTQYDLLIAGFLRSRLAMEISY